MDPGVSHQVPAAPKRKILLSAFACDPITGSEPYVGWNWALMLADDYDVHVLTRSYSRKLIVGHPDALKVTFHYADYFGFEQYHHHWRYIKPYYILWQILVLFKIIALRSQHSFDLVHHVTYNNIDVPGFLWLVPQTRFIWGPVGGGQTPPRSLATVYGRAWWKEQVRGLLKASARYNPIIRGAVRRASMVLLANQETADRLAGLRFPSVIISETAISAVRLPDPGIHRPRDGRVRLLWLSHVFARKGLVLAIDGFRNAVEYSAGRLDIELIVVGDGAALAASKELADRTGISNRITFLGAVSYSEVDRHFAEADIFLFTSVQDTSGNVLLEAMRNAKPIIALDHQGAKALVTQGGARLVAIGSYDETTRRIGAAIVELAGDFALRERMGRASLHEVSERHTWTAKRTQILKIYEGAISGPRATTDGPAFSS
jgi:glycosyltransferase involved in cell wall biosynthesis